MAYLGENRILSRTFKEGKSAYEVAVKNGFKGTEAEWLETLKGKSAYEIAVTNGFKGTEEEWLAFLENREAIANAIAGENNRKDNENIRISNENIRVTRESDRVTNENNRKDNENNRKDNEDKRVANENLRIDNENKRVLEESGRALEESGRVLAENERKTNEDGRKYNENERKDNENERKTNENSRSSAEILRQAHEDEREDNENERKDNENSRSSAESNRVTEEANRNESEYGNPNYRWDKNRRCVVDGNGIALLDEMIGGRFGAEIKRNALIGDIESAIDAILDIQSDLLSNIRTFTLNNLNKGVITTYEFERGMTWGEWVANTEYNTDGFMTEGFGMVQNIEGYIYKNQEERYNVYKDEVIEAEYEYYLYW